MINSIACVLKNVILSFKSTCAYVVNNNVWINDFIKLTTISLNYLSSVFEWEKKKNQTNLSLLKLKNSRNKALYIKGNKPLLILLSVIFI